MNHAAIDTGVKNVNKIDVPESWKTATGSDLTITREIDCDRPELKKFVEDVMYPIAHQKGDDLPVSTFSSVEDGTFPQGSAAYEKRGVAVNAPKWIPENCIQCNQCAYVCPHAVVRPFVLDENDMTKAPDGYKTMPMTGKGCDKFKYAINLSVKDCYGCDICANVCPPGKKGKSALVMEPLHTQLDEQKRYDWAFANVLEKPEVEAAFKKETVKGSQFLQPLLEFSGACAGCGETPYAKLITQLYGDRMYIANSTGCSSIWGGNAPATPYTVNRDGKGPTWCNSLFEDTAEFGYGMMLGVTQRRAKVASTLEKIASKCGDADLVAAAKEWLASKDDGDGSKIASKKLEAALDKCKGDCCGDDIKFLNSNRDMFVKKSIWAFGGDGWAYDIGFGGLDHVLASGEDINILVFDTEVYSNTGGQSSKASQIGQVAQFAAVGKGIDKKDLASMMIAAYPYVYVAQIAMGASQKQTIDAIVEAESYPGPSIIIAYSPCVAHGMKGGLGISHEQTKRAVDAGYWHNFRYDPRLKAEGKSAFKLDSKAPTSSYVDFINDETRYTSLKVLFPERAEQLFKQAAKTAEEKYKILEKYQDMY